MKTAKILLVVDGEVKETWELASEYDFDPEDLHDHGSYDMYLCDDDHYSAAEIGQAIIRRAKSILGL